MSPDGQRRVVITGMGVLSPLGHDPRALWQSLAAGQSGIGPVEHLNLAPFRSRVGGAVRNFNPRQFIADPKSFKLMTRSVRLGVAAAESAIAASGWQAGADDNFRLASLVGSPGHAGERDELLPGLEQAWREGELNLEAFGERGIAVTNPLWLLKSLANIVLYFVSLKLGAQGYNANYCMSGAGGIMAIGEGARAIASNRADLAVAGGYESLLDEERLESFERSGLLVLESGEDATASRPFDRDRRGFVPGEGGAFVVLEELGHARQRGAHIWAEVLGFGLANPGRAQAPFASHESTAAFSSAMQSALGEARLDAWELNAIFAHGLGTPHADRCEAEAIKQCLTARAAYVPVTAVKSLSGNLAAGSGPLEVIAAVGSLQADGPGVPAIANCRHPDPDLGLDLVRGRARAGQCQKVLINSASLSGATASLVLGGIEA